MNLNLIFTNLEVYSDGTNDFFPFKEFLQSIQISHKGKGLSYLEKFYKLKPFWYKTLKIETKGGYQEKIVITKQAAIKIYLFHYNKEIENTLLDNFCEKITFKINNEIYV